MKFLLVSLAIIAVASAQYDSQQQQTSEPIPIVRYDHDSSPDGTYSWRIETGDGTKMAESGTQGESDGENGPSIYKQGSYSWTAPDGIERSVTYLADDSGFHPQGDHFPTPPPSPAPILRALEYIRSHPNPDNQ